MHQITRGSGKPLLLIHGLGSSWHTWRPILDDLAAERSIIAVDLPGHGATPAEQDSGTFQGLVDSVERYLVANDLIGIDVVGSSMGARIVLELARRGKVGNVVALDPGGFWRGWERPFFRTTIGLSVNRHGNGDRDRHVKGYHPLAVVPGYVGGGRSPEPTYPGTTSSLAPAATALSFGS